MTRQERSCELFGQKDILIDETPIDRPFEQERSRQLECARHVSACIDQQERQAEHKLSRVNWYLTCRFTVLPAVAR